MINKFEGYYHFLSNFYPCSVTVDGYIYQNSEAAFQAAKVVDNKLKKVFTYLPPSEAKYLGRHIKLRSDWERVKDKVMYEVVKAKFIQNPDLHQMLLATGEEELVEGTLWNDQYWGINLKTGEGENHLGQILMQVRKEFQEEEFAKRPVELYAKCISFTAGMNGDGEKCKEFLILNQYYKVKDVDMGGFHTDITLKGMSEVTFNSVNFEFYLKNAQGEYVLHDIYRDPEYNKVLA